MAFSLVCSGNMKHCSLQSMTYLACKNVNHEKWNPVATGGQQWLHLVMAFPCENSRTAGQTALIFCLLLWTGKFFFVLDVEKKRKTLNYREPSPQLSYCELYSIACFLLRAWFLMYNVVGRCLLKQFRDTGQTVVFALLLLRERCWYKLKILLCFDVFETGKFASAASSPNLLIFLRQSACL